MRRTLNTAALFLLVALTGCNMYSAGYSREALSLGYGIAADQRQSGGIDLGDPTHMVPTPTFSSPAVTSAGKGVKESSIQKVRDILMSARQANEFVNGVTAQAERLNLPISEDGWQAIMSKLSVAKARWYGSLRQ